MVCGGAAASPVASMDAAAVAAAVRRQWWYGSAVTGRPSRPNSCVCNAMEMTSAPIFFKLHTHRE